MRYKTNEVITLEGYFLAADLLGFKNIIQNTSETELTSRIDAWLSLVGSAATKGQVAKTQLISDTVFAAADSNSESFRGLLEFSKYLLLEGIKQSLPVRGAISYGTFEWGRLTHGKAVIRAHELEMAQNWIGITCDNQIPHLNDNWGLDSIICYPTPMKSGEIRLHPVISWNVPDFQTLIRSLCKGGLIKDGEILSWFWGEKVSNTAQFGLYRTLLKNQGKDVRNFYGFLPIEAIHLALLGQ
jgi:hypothetical protein